MAGKLTPRTPFAYRAANTALHRIPAIVKLLCVIVLSTAAFTTIYGLAAAILLTIVFSIIAHIPPWELFKGSKPLVVMSLIIILVKMNIIHVSIEGLFDGILIALRIMVTFAAAALLFSVTTMRELRLSLTLIENGIKRLFGSRQKNAIPFFSLGISLMLGFIPRFFELWEGVNLACEARSCKRGIRRLIIVLPLVTERMIEAAAETALALEARGLGYGE